MTPFMVEFYRDTEQVGSMRVKDGVEIDIRKYMDDDRIHFYAIRTIGGNANKVLEWLCRLADKHQTTLWGHVRPYGQERLNEAKLIRWYRLYGFQVGPKETVHKDAEPAHRVTRIPL